MVTHFLKRLLDECSISEDNLKQILDEFYLMKFKLPEKIQQRVEKKIAEIKAEVKERSYIKFSLKKDSEEKKTNDRQPLIFQKSKNFNVELKIKLFILESTRREQKRRQ